MSLGVRLSKVLTAGTPNFLGSPLQAETVETIRAEPIADALIVCIAFRCPPVVAFDVPAAARLLDDVSVTPQAECHLFRHASSEKIQVQTHDDNYN